LRIQVLDHGYVELVEAWGTGNAGVEEISMMNQEVEKPTDYECGIIEAARQSTQGSFRGWDQDAKLLGFLFNNRPPHATPFEFAGMVIEVRAPILVFREWHRHRTQSYNEMSARYAPLPALDYQPTVERCLTAGGHLTTNKQAQSVTGRSLKEKDAGEWLADLERLYAQVQAHYQLGLDIGLPKEIARCAMVVARYSQMRASASLRNWLAFLTLRMDSNAQWEIRQYANAVGQCIAETFPQTWKLFNHG
jgi:thymidylate synthase (FAD)